MKKDWIKRDEKDFVHRSEERSGWERGRSSLTDYLLDKDDIPRGREFEIKKAYQLCQDRAAVLSEKPARIIFSEKEETGKTDGKRVFVSTKVMDERKDFVEKSDILLGITTHEMAHVMHSEFDGLKKLDRFTHSIWNIIEDERIEHLIGEEFPGYSGNLASVKKYFFEEKYLLDAEKREELEKKYKAELSPEDIEKLELYDLFFKFVRYPKMVDNEMVAKHETMIEELKEVLTPYPMKSIEVTKAAKAVAKVLRKAMDDETPMEEEEKGEEEGGSTGGAGGMPTSTLEDIISEAMTFAESDNEEGGKKEKEAAKNLDDFDYAEAIIDDKLNQCIFRNAIPNEHRYKEFVTSIKGDAQLLARTLHLRTFNESKDIKGMRSGRLDDNRIVEAVHGVKTVYSRRIEKIDKKMNMVLLIDESGSMGDGIKDVNAAKSAILLEQCYKLFPLGQLFIYGFTSDLSEDEPYFNRVIRYKEPGFELKYGLGDVRGRANNRDGMCIRAVAQRVRTFTQEPMLFFIISDGQPAASGAYGGMAGIQDTAKAVKEVTMKKFFPIQIGIGVHESVQKMMFTDYVNYRDSRQMVEDLRRLLVKKAHKFIGI